ncbi:MAG TPA: RdgB/HAM1 family non-canonical purine NTP pyrophosphatase [Anaerolineae bacterium]|nr:RdgB/HAM1 family non-canonical purine NTP pyrophosphatase [Anaerolineae bacterium]
MKLLIATNNQHKIKEYQQIFADIPFEITTPRQEGLTLDPEETGTSFAENALIKARAFAEASGLLTLADDSGLEVDALNKAPGIYSARYGNTDKEDHQKRYQLVLEQLQALNAPTKARSARFKCVIAIVSLQGQVEVVEGAVEGQIASAPAGENGFGYDPIFFLPEFGKTMAQLEDAEKHAISHRGRAAQTAIPVLQRMMESSKQ